MTSAQQARAKQPVNALVAGPYGHPYHPILVTLPIGAWVSSLVFDIGSHVVDDGAFLAKGAQWLIVIGVIGAVLAAAVGLVDLLAIPRGTPAFSTAVTHLCLNLAVTAAFVAGFLWRQAEYGEYDSTGWGQLVLSAVAIAVLGVSGYLGGKLAFHYGVRVADEGTQAAGFTS